MSNLYSILPNIELTSSDIAEAEIFAQQYLQALYPDLDLREGTAIRDLAIRPAATLIALVNKGIEFHFEDNTIAGVTDATDQDKVDAIMSNLFLERNEGTRAKVSARMYFSRPKSVTIPVGTTFSTDDVVKFRPDRTYVFSAGQMTKDEDSNEYYVDVFLESTGEGSEYNIESGSLLYFTNFDTFFLRGEISYLKESSTPKETNSEFIARANTAISTRNLINTPSIASKLQAEFNYISRVVAAGHGHADMIRDMKDILGPSGYSTTVHLGGKTDVHCAVPLLKDIEQFVVGSDGTIRLSGAYLDVRPTAINGGPLENTIGTMVPYSLKVGTYSGGKPAEYEDDLGFSSKQEMVITYGRFYAGQVVSFETWKFQGVDSIQSYVDSPSNRVTCSDMLVRAMPVYQMDVKIKTYDQVLPLAADIRPVVESYLRNIPAGEALNMSDLISALYEGTDMRGLVTPIQVSYVLIKRNRAKYAGIVTDVLKPESDTYRFELKDLTIESAS